MTKTIRFIGDIHGSYGMYAIRVMGVPDSVQVGDFGFGFGQSGSATYIDNVLYKYAQGSHRMIRGNHDNPDEMKKSNHFIPDGTIEGNVMYIGGAASIDKHMRTEGVDFWSKEESSDEELEALVKLYGKTKPNILVTHECPEFFSDRVMVPLVGGIANFRSRTREAFDRMYIVHKPKIHIFGHWHKDVDQVWGKTRMICLGIGSVLDLEVE